MMDEKRLLTAIFEDEEKTAKALKKASAWMDEHNKYIGWTQVADAVDVARMGLAEDFDRWDEMGDEEKNDLAELMCGLSVAHDVIVKLLEGSGSASSSRCSK